MTMLPALLHIHRQVCIVLSKKETRGTVWVTVNYKTQSSGTVFALPPTHHAQRRFNSIDATLLLNTLQGLPFSNHKWGVFLPFSREVLALLSTWYFRLQYERWYSRVTPAALRDLSSTNYWPAWASNILPGTATALFCFIIAKKAFMF